jgi:hypothetical protein
MRRTESGDLERQFVFYEVAAAEAKAKAILIKMRLEGLYQSRTDKNNGPAQNLISKANTNDTDSVRSFNEVRDQITAASSTQPALSSSPLPVDTTIATVPKKESIYKMELPFTSVSQIPMPLALSTSDLSISDSEQSIESTKTPILIYAADQQDSLVNNNQQ